MTIECLHCGRVPIIWNTVAAFWGMHVSPAKHSYAWQPRKRDFWTDTHTHGRTDRCRTKWSLCAAGDTINCLFIHYHNKFFNPHKIQLTKRRWEEQIMTIITAKNTLTALGGSWGKMKALISVTCQGRSNTRLSMAKKRLTVSGRNWGKMKAL